jgi:hypothetical protein
LLSIGHVPNAICALDPTESVSWLVKSERALAPLRSSQTKPSP